MAIMIRVLTGCFVIGALCGLSGQAFCQDAAPAGATTVPASGPATTQPGVEGKIIQGQAEEWLTKMFKGGWTIFALLILSVIALACALERLFMLRRGRIVPRGLSRRADRLWGEGKREDILKLCSRRSRTLARILVFITEHPRASIADVSTATGDIGARELKRHLLRAYPLAVVATLAPLLGLLGTVIGMIEAFDTVVVVGMGDATALAGGISKALITTMVGLCIAVPSLFAYHFFKSRTSLFAVILEEEVTELISAWRMEEDADDES